MPSSKSHPTAEMEEQYMSRSVSMDSLCSDDDNELRSQYIHFYTERIVTTQRLKNNMTDNLSRPGIIKRTALETAMDTLRKEMVAVMDQDLALAKQLLILQETIGDLLTAGDTCEPCDSSDTCSETHSCASCSHSQTDSGKLHVTASVRDHTKYCAVDSGDIDRRTSVKLLNRGKRGGHQKQNSNDSGVCCIFQDLEVTI